MNRQMNNASTVNTSVLTSLLVIILAFVISAGTVSPAYAGNSLFQYKPASENGSAKLVKGVVKIIFIVAAIQGGKKHLQKYLVRKAANDPRFKQGLIKQIKGYIKNNPKYKKKALALLAAIIGASATKEFADDRSQLSELEDRQYRTFLANGGDTSVEDWWALGKPDAPAQVASKSRFNRFKDKFKTKVNSAAKRLKAKIDKLANVNESAVVQNKINSQHLDLIVSHPNAHSLSVHGGSVSDGALILRAKSAIKPNGDVGPSVPPLSSAFNSDELLVFADQSVRNGGGLQRAIARQPGQDVIRVTVDDVGDIGTVLGRGFKRVLTGGNKARNIETHGAPVRVDNTA